jgi:hypothetical protein
VASSPSGDNAPFPGLLTGGRLFGQVDWIREH